MMKAKRNQDYSLPEEAGRLNHEMDGWRAAVAVPQECREGRSGASWAEDSLPPAPVHRPSVCCPCSVSYPGFLKSPSETSSLTTLSENYPASTPGLWSNYFPPWSLKSVQSI